MCAVVFDRPRTSPAPPFSTALNSWIANHAIKVFCANGDKETNDFAAELCGKNRQMFFGGSNGPQEDYDPISEMFGHGPKCTATFSQQYHYEVPPNVFVSQLRRGGAADKFTVDAIVTRPGQFSNGKPFFLANFKQELST